MIARACHTTHYVSMSLLRGMRLSSVWLLGCVLCVPGVFILLPDLILRHGMVAVVLWAIGIITVAFPFLALGLTMSFTLRGSPAKNLRRIHRPFAALGVVQTAVTFLIGMMLVVVSTWSLTILADILIDLVSGRGTRLGQSLSDIRQHWLVVIGDSDLHSMSATQLGRPLGGLLIVAVLLWLIIHQVLNSERVNFRGLIQTIFALFVVLCLGLLLSVARNGLPLFLSPGAEGGLAHPQTGLYPLGVWADLLSVVFMCGALGTGFISQLLMQDGRSRDSLSSLGVGLMVCLMVGACWLALIGVGYSSFNFMHIDGYLPSASSIDVLFLQVPVGIYAAGGGWWGVLLALLFLIILGLSALCAALLFLRSASIQLQRDFALPLHEVQTRLIMVGMLCTLAFCTEGGVGLWLAMIDGVRFVLLPLMFFWLWWGVTLHLGFSGFVDYLRTTSAIPMAKWWASYVRVAMPFILLLYLLGSILVISGTYELPSLWNPLLIMIPLLAVIIYGWWYYKRGMLK